ncbi:hypothetical protein [Streptomyces hirsutus]|uniref:hypothetical protein n=1 Tax=Streptomyces hirsutus TaxID=35620 RepID=UPI0033B5D549
MLSALTPSAVLDVPFWLVICGAAVLMTMLLLVAVVSWGVLRLVNQDQLPVALLGLAHVISALCGFLPWGKPTPPPALPQPQAPEPESGAMTVVLVQEEPAGGTLTHRGRS